MTNPWRNMLLAICLIAGTQSFAEDTAPDALVKGITADVIAAIRQDKGIQAGNMAKINALVEARILPHFDFERATREAMGFNWRQATPEQRSRLTGEFRTLLTRTYSGTLASGIAGNRGGIRPGEDRSGVEDLRCQSRRHEPHREL